MKTKKVMREKKKVKKIRKDSVHEDLKWLTRDTEIRQLVADHERRERNRRLAERDKAYAKAFPDMVKHGRLAHEVVNDEMADLRRRFVG